MAQPTVETTATTESTQPQAAPGDGPVHSDGTFRRSGLGQASGTARVAGVTAMAAVTGAIRGRIHSGTHPHAGTADGSPEPVVHPPDPAVIEPTDIDGSPPVAVDGPVSPAAGPDGQAAEPAEPAEPAETEATLVLHLGRWTAQRALAELPDTPAASIEVLDGSLVVSPRRGIRHQTVMLEFGIALKRAARTAGYGMHPQIKVIVGDELVTPDLTVATRLGEDTTCVGVHEVVLVAEVVLADHGRMRRLDRTPIYAAGKIGHYLRLDFRGHDPVISLHELVEGEYRPVAVASVGARFATSRPFDFAIDPVQLRGGNGQPRIR